MLHRKKLFKSALTGTGKATVSGMGYGRKQSIHAVGSFDSFQDGFSTWLGGMGEKNYKSQNHRRRRKGYPAYREILTMGVCIR